MHQLSDHIQQLAMCLFCLKLAIRSAHTSGTRVSKCWAAAGQEGLRGLALAVLPLAKELSPSSMHPIRFVGGANIIFEVLENALLGLESWKADKSRGFRNDRHCLAVSSWRSFVGLLAF